MRANVKHVWVICKFGICHEIASGSSLGAFSVVKHLYSLEIALYCYKELRRNILDFWSRFKTKNLRKLHILRLHAWSVICIKNQTYNSQEGGTTFARHVQILPRHRLTNQTCILCFNQQQITKELRQGFPRALLAICHAQEKSSGVENAVKRRGGTQCSWENTENDPSNQAQRIIEER